MYINEVESIVRLSKKSIRYYEEQGLINPKRNSDNDYRIYDDNDIKKLKTIKFLRDLGVPISDLKKLESKELELNDCIKERINKIENEEDKYLSIKEMCQNIINNNNEYDNLNIESYSKKMNILNKEGFTMKETKNNKKKYIIDALISSSIAVIFFGLLISFFIGIQLTETEKMPIPIFIILALLFGLPIIGIIINLINRIKEINGGEEDEASKY